MSKLFPKAYWLLLVLFFFCSVAKAQSPPQLSKDNIKEVIAALTLEEKASLVTGVPEPFPDFSRPGPPPMPDFDKGIVPGAAGTSQEIPRLGITPIILADGPAGLRILPTRKRSPDATFYCTAFPIATLLASSWDVDLVEGVGQAIGNEVKEYGVDLLLAPALNLHRYPLGGRNFEYFSEDPLLSGSMAAAITRGAQSQGVGTTLKHFVANNHEWNRRVINVKVDERAFREIYLKGFEIAIKKGKPWAVMTSYNKVNGVYTSESPRLLTEILRDQWGFEGMVTTDWDGGVDAAAQMAAGNDLLMPGRDQERKEILDAVKEKKLDEALLDRNVERILDTVVKSPRFSGYQYYNKPDLKANARLARAAAAEGMVLLKNNAATLPLAPGDKLAVLGLYSYQMITGGTGSGDVNEAYSISLLKGLTAAGLQPNAELKTSYEDYIESEKAKQPPRSFFMPAPPIAELEIGAEKLNELALATDKALVTIGRRSGEFRDREVENDFYLSEVEQKWLKSVAKAFHAQGKKVVVILNIGGVVETASWRDLADAILLAWQPGQEAGFAIADVLIGKVNPSGKLATTFSLKLEDFPPVENFPGKVLLGPDPDSKAPPFMRGARDAEIEYRDGIWVGYRHFNSNNIETAYPFGFGLSYTSFEYSDLKLSSTEVEESLTATVTVKNSGKVAGKEVVQLYVSAPQAKLTKPVAELRAFAKTKLLSPGETQTLTFELSAADLSSFDEETSSWLAEAGKYTVKIGASSTDIRLRQEFDKKQASRVALKQTDDVRQFGK